MIKSEYINSVLGTPWVNRQTDCWWLVCDYYYHVMGYTLKSVSGYIEGGDFLGLWSENIKSQWDHVPNYREGAMITLYDASGRAVHVGVCIGDMNVLHSKGSESISGKVEVSKLAAMLKVYNKATYHLPKGFL